ncbi:RepB family plasmid replication initiator protein [Xenorhabdus sp. KJ12.1]|uniref:RepB family plasmid replication initiator protein n=1 Tax=Xenorhabdus sp. KJ12.1 TaxID=1851571 RepID=UPI000C0446FF|nr:RepB family plasmid replication initiator protein [Xenorhabdus sp. KJ12.1]
MKKDSKNIRLFKDAIPEPTNDTHRKLTVTMNSSVQPAVLMKMGVFVPTKKKGSEAAPIDASESLSKLEHASREGYSDVLITGPRLNLSTDFKIWMGIIHSFSRSEDALKGNKIRLKFTEFARNCQYPNKRFDARLRKEIAYSLARIRGKTITFSKPGSTKVYITGLLKTGEFDTETNTVILEADENLWELYNEDNLTLLRKKPLSALPRKEAAQAIYTYIASLPANPVPLSFKRLRERLLLPSTKGEQNRIIRNALEDLKKIGYLDYHLYKDKEDKENIVKIISRNPTLHPES